MNENEKLVVYKQKDMQLVWNFLNTLQVNGVTAARQLASIATIIEAGKPLEDYLTDQEGGMKNGNDGEVLHTEDMEEPSKR